MYEPFVIWNLVTLITRYTKIQFQFFSCENMFNILVSQIVDVTEGMFKFNLEI